VTDDQASVPVELSEALDQADAWLEWDEQPADVRSMYIDWVAKPRRAGERRSRAEVTAYYAFHGALDKGIQRESIWKSLLKLVGDAVS
jgi:hypothetical protein